MIQVPIIIRGVLPDRQAFVDYLKEALPEAQWCFDQKRNAMDTFLRGLAMAGEGGALHMEDDAVIGADFREKVAAVISSKPGNVINFFSARGDDLTKGSRWDSYFSYNICFYMPPGYSASLLRYFDHWTQKDKHPTGYDIMLTDWMKARKERHWIHVPSLVDHQISKSTIDPRRARVRQSKTFQGV